MIPFTATRQYLFFRRIARQTIRRLLHIATPSVPATTSATIVLLFCLLVNSYAQQSSLLQQSRQQNQQQSSAGISGVTVSGIVSEAQSGESVIGVTVLIVRDSSQLGTKPVGGARTNKFGFYSIAGVPQGSYFLVVRGIGYKTFIQPIAVNDVPLRKNIALQNTDVRSQEVSVTAERQAAPTSNISVVQVSTDFIKKMPAIGGEADIFRVLQLMPGIKSGGELSSGLYVRGGSPDQNLVLLDGVIVYNPTHLGGFLSTFNSDAIRDVRVIKGAFPAEYGGRLSSVIDLTMKEGSKEKISGAANISLIASRLTVEGPIAEDLTFMVSGRRTYLDLLVNAVTANLPANQRPPSYYFYDLNAKINYKLSENDRLFVSGYFGRDVLGAAPGSNFDFGIDWGNSTGNLRWMHVVSPELFTNFSAIYTDYQFSTNLGGNGGFSFNSLSRIRDVMLRGDMQYFPTQEHTIKAGVEATWHNFTTLVGSSSEQFNRVLSDPALGLNNSIGSLEAGIYAQDEWNNALGVSGLSANAGLRLAYFQQGTRLLPEPRLSLTYELGEQVVGNNFTLKGAFAIANQFLHLVVRNDLALPTDTWFPSTETILPANATQYVLGAETTFFGNELLVSIEGYYKFMRNLLEYRDDANFNLFAPREQDLTRGTGESYGVEVFINKRAGAFTGWIGYTLSWTTRQFDELNGGRPFAPRYDTRHDIYITGTYKLSDAWEFGATWTFTSGQAFTMPSNQYFFDPSRTYIPANLPQRVSAQPTRDFTFRGFTERNAFRLPPFHKLDVNITHYFTWFNLPFNLSLSAYNAYNRANPFAWVLQTNTSGQTEVVQLSLFPIIPSLALGFKF
jgi:hypothetical protein